MAELKRRILNIVIVPFEHDNPTALDRTLYAALGELGYFMSYAETKDTPEGLRYRAETKDVVRLRYASGYFMEAAEVRGVVSTVTDVEPAMEALPDGSARYMVIFSRPTDEQATALLESQRKLSLDMDAKGLTTEERFTRLESSVNALLAQMRRANTPDLDPSRMTPDMIKRILAQAPRG